MVVNINKRTFMTPVHIHSKTERDGHAVDLLSVNEYVKRQAQKKSNSSHLSV